MKRWLSAVLACILCLLPISSGMGDVLAEAVDGAPEAVEAAPAAVIEAAAEPAAPAPVAQAAEPEAAASESAPQPAETSVESGASDAPEAEATSGEGDDTDATDDAGDAAGEAPDSGSDPQGEPEAQAQGEEEAAGEAPASAQAAPAPEAGPAGTAISSDSEEVSYLYFAARGMATVYRDAGLTKAFFTVRGGDALLMTDARRRGAAVLPMSFNTPGGVADGYVRAADVNEMTDAEVAAFKAGLSGGIEYYGNDRDYPLAKLTDATVPQPVAQESAPAGDIIEEGSEAAGEPDDASEELSGDPSGAARLIINSQAEPAAGAAVAPTKIEISKSLLWVGLGEYSEELTATLLPEGSAATVTWSASNTAVVKVDASTGAIYGASTGTAKIYARTANGLEAVCDVAVRSAPTGVTLDKTRMTLSANGQTARLTASLSSGSASATMTFTSSDERVAMIDGTGLVTTVNPGAAVLTVRTYNGKTASCELTVTGEPQTLTLSAEQCELFSGKSTTLTAEARDAAGQTVSAELTYFVDPESADPDCVRVNAQTGEVTGVRSGSAKVCARTHNGVASGACEVQVAAVPAGVTVNKASVEIGVGETYRGLSASVIAPEGEESCAAEVAWTTSNASIVKADLTTGEIYGVKAGTANIVVWTVNGKYAITKVTVRSAPTKVTLSAPTSVLEEQGGTVQMIATVPSGSASGTLAYFSSDTNVAEVDENGLVTARNPGKATITVWTYNGKGAAFTLTVVPRPASLIFESGDMNLAVGQTLNVKATPFAEDGSATIANVSYYLIPVTRDEPCLTLNEATGAITGTQRGKVKIGARTASGIEAEPIEVTVIVAPAGIKLNYTSGSIGLGETNTNLIATLIPPSGEASCESTITWYSSDKSIVNVDAGTGAIYGAKLGSAKVYAMTHNGKYAVCTVTVKNAPSKITISPTSVVMTEGQTGQFQTTLPSGTASGMKYFFSSDPEVLSVDNMGNVVALAPGSATVTVWTYNGKGASAVVSVRSKDTLDADMPMPLASTTSSYNAGMTPGEKLEYVIYVAQSKLGKPYVWGAFGPDKFDCSGFTYYCFKQIGVELKQSAYTQGYDSGLPMISSLTDLRRGDLVYFNTVNDSDLSDHAGIYLGNGYFIHASSGGGKVMVSNLASGYYNRVFSWGRRVFY